MRKQSPKNAELIIMVPYDDDRLFISFKEDSGNKRSFVVHKESFLKECLKLGRRERCFTNYFSNQS